MEGQGSQRTPWTATICRVPVVGKAMCWVLSTCSSTFLRQLCRAPALNPGQWVQVGKGSALAAGMFIDTLCGTVE